MPGTDFLTVAVASLYNTTTAGTRVHVGMRLQSGTLPAIVIEQMNAERGTIGRSSGLRRYSWKISAIDNTMTAATTLAEAASVQARDYLNNAGHTTVCTSLPVIEDPISGDGDEQLPAVSSLTLETMIGDY